VTVEAVLFDAGETLLSPHPSFAHVFSEVLTERGSGVTPEDVSRAFARVAPLFPPQQVVDEMDGGLWSVSEQVSRKFWGAVYTSAFQEMGVTDDGTFVDALYERFTRFESYRLFPDVLPALEGLRASGIRVGLISNFESWLKDMLEHWGIHDVFDVAVISGIEGIEKPDPKIFNVALERMGVTAEVSAYVGDHPEIDVVGSEAVGMLGILIDRKERHTDHRGVRITDLGSLQAALNGPRA
jgi:putative hydrolase of the HAD superfamily